MYYDFTIYCLRFHVYFIIEPGAWKLSIASYASVFELSMVFFSL